MIEKKDIENFYIISIFDVKEGFYLAGIKRAYLDFCRTLSKKEYNEKEEERNKTRDEVGRWLSDKLKKLIGIKCENQEEFDIKHKKLSKELKEKWGKNFTIGQSQKWINMTLKYWSVFGDKRIPNIYTNCKLFHIPIDSIVQETMFSNLKPHNPWSKIDKYEEYFKYQEHYRENKSEYFAIEDELKIFNKYFLEKQSQE